MFKLNKKTLFITIALLIAIFSVFLFFFRSKFQTDTFVVKRGDVVRTVRASGVTVKGAEYDLNFIQGGKIDVIYAWVGREVKKGDMLASVYNAKEIRDHNSAVEILKNAEDRYRKILNDTSIDTQIKQRDLDLALSDIFTAQVVVDATKKVVENTRIRAPIDGVITKISSKTGDVVDDDLSILTISDKENLYIESEMSIYEGLFITREQRVYVDNKIQGTVTGIKRSGEKISISILSNSNFEEGENLQVKIITAESKDTLLVPRDALNETESGYFVHIANPDNLKDIEKSVVSIGLTGDDGIVEIKSGVKEGDIVVWENTQK